MMIPVNQTQTALVYSKNVIYFIHSLHCPYRRQVKERVHMKRVALLPG